MQITFDPFNPHERNVVTAVLSNIPAGEAVPATEPGMVNNPGSDAPDFGRVAGGDAGVFPGEALVRGVADASSAPETKKRGRKAKVVEPEPAPAPISEESLDDSEDDGEDNVVGDDNPPSIDDVRLALQNFATAKGVPAATALLQEFGAARIKELNEGDYHAFVKRCAQ